MKQAASAGSLGSAIRRTSILPLEMSKVSVLQKRYSGGDERVNELTNNDLYKQMTDG